jgi:hypothetical protein
MRAKYVHTNLIGKGWEKLAAFYERVLGCIPVPPEPALSGEWLDALTCVPKRCTMGTPRRRR